MPGIPLVFVFERAYAAIEKKIGADRDRKEFGTDLREFFLKQIDSSLLSGNTFAQRDVINACRIQWEQGTGNQLLQIMSRGATWSLKTSASELFGDRFFAHCKLPDNHAARLQHEQITRQWKSTGKIELPGYFEQFGVVTVENHVKQLEEKARNESMAQGRRPPTDLEQAALNVLGECLTLLAPALTAFLKTTSVEYTIAKTDVLLGQFKSARSYRSKEVFFSTQIFGMGFSQALGLYCHEHAHVFGYDSSRGFTDALTELLESAVANRVCFDDMEAEWARATERVLKPDDSDPSDPNQLAQRIVALPQKVLLARLSQMELTVLQQLANEGHNSPIK